MVEKVLQTLPHFLTDQVLDVLVNIKHTLSPDTMTLIEQVNTEFCERLTDNYSPTHRDQYI